MRFLTLLLILIFALSCQHQNGVNKTAKTGYSKIISERLGEGVQYQKNESGTNVLCKVEHKSINGLETRFILYDLEQEQILLEDAVYNGSVQWISDSEIQVKNTPGMVTTDPEQNKKMQGYIFNLNTNQKEYR